MISTPEYTPPRRPRAAWRCIALLAVLLSGFAPTALAESCVSSVTAAAQTFDAYFEIHDGKSWLLIGRGREGWEFDADGQGLVGDVSQDLGTSAAFAPAAYSDAIVNDLLAQANLALCDAEFRLKRAIDVNGVGYQDLRWTEMGGTAFSFDFDNTKRVTTRIVGNQGVVLNAGTPLEVHRANTRDTNPSNGYPRVFTWAWGGHNNEQGFSYGSDVNYGTNNATTFIWEFGDEQHAIPYTEFYVEYPMPCRSTAEDNVLAEDAPGLVSNSGPVNLAIGGTASQLCDGAGGVAARAIDGNCDGNWGNASTTHTCGAANSWWKVNLNGGVSEISEIIVHNRDDCCGTRLSNFFIEIYNGDPHGGGALVWSQEYFDGSGSVPQGGSQSTGAAIPGGTTGDWVLVRLDGNNNDGNGTLSLAEVRVRAAVPTVPTADAVSALGATITTALDGTFTYNQLGVAALRALAPGASATDTFSYILQETPTTTSSQTMVVTVHGAAHPDAVDDTIVAAESVTTTRAATGLMFNDPNGLNPPVTNGLILWLDANDTSSIDTAAGEVTSWNDKSGQENHFNQFETNRPTYPAAGPNGTSVVAFDDAFLKPSQALSAKEYTIVSVARYSGAERQRVISSDTMNWLFGFHDNIVDRFYAEGWLTQGGTNGNGLAWQLHAGTMNSNPDPRGSFWRNGTQLVTNSNGSNNNVYEPGVLALGGHNSGAQQDSDCEVAEILFFDRVLSAAELDELGGYLDYKWGLTTNYPAWFPAATNKVVNVHGTNLGGAGPVTITTPQGASFTITSDGAYTYDPRASVALRALAPGSTIVDGFTYTIQEDGSAQTDIANVSITVQGAGLSPDAIDDTATTPETDALVTAAPGVIENDMDDLPVTDGLVLQLDASNTSSVVTDGGNKVTAWNDISGQGNHFDQYEGGNRATYSADGPNGRSVVAFSDAHLKTTTDFTEAVLAEYTMFSVARYADFGSGQTQRVISSDNRNWLFGFWGSGVDNFHPTGWVNGPTGTLDFDWHIHAGRVTSGDASSFWGNGTLLASNSRGASDTVYAPGILALGGYQNEGSDDSACEIAEILLFDRVLTPAELDAVGSYLDRKWAVGTTYPSTAPFKVTDVNGTALGGAGPVTTTSTLGATVTMTSDGAYSYDPHLSATIRNVASGATIVDTFTYILQESSTSRTDQATVSVIVTGNGSDTTALTEDELTSTVTGGGTNLRTNDDGTLGNVAVYGTASQSTTTNGGVASRAIDGIPNGQWAVASTTHTNTSLNWWKVALASSVEISTISVWNRADCCGTRLANFRVQVYEGDPDAGGVQQYDVAFAGPVAQGGSQDFAIPAGTYGDYVRINHNGANLTFNIAEVQVWSPVDITATDTVSAKGGAVSINSDGTFTYDPSGSVALQALTAGQTATDTFTYTTTITGHWNATFVGIAGGGGATDTGVSNTTEAELLLDNVTGTGAITIGSVTYNVNRYGTGTPQTINFNGGNFGGDLPALAGNTNGNSNNWTVGATAHVIIPAGTYSVAFGSDDGGSIQFLSGGITYSSVFNSVTDAASGEARFEGGRGHAWTGGTFTVATETEAEISAMFHQGGGGDSFEVAVASGTSTNVLDGSWSLLGPGVEGWEFLSREVITTLVTVTGLNDAPELTENVGPSPGGSTDSNTPIELIVADLINNGGASTTVNDPDGPAESIAVTGVTAFNNPGHPSGPGVWEYSTNNGGTYTAFPGGLSDANAVLISETGGRLRFTPAPFDEAGVASFTFRGWDELSGSSGDTGVNTVPNGGTTRFSSNTDTGDILVSDFFAFAPELVAAAPNNLGTITEDFAAQTFALTDYIYNSATPPGGRTGVTDLDGGENFEGIAVTGVSATAGTWAYSTDGANFTNFTGAEADNNATLIGATNGTLRYTPGTVNGETLTSVTFRAWDATIGANGQAGADASTNGGNSIFSSNTDTFELTVLNVNDAPVLTTAPPDFGQVEAAATTTAAVSSFITNVVSTTSTQITDVDTGQADDGIIVTGLFGAGTWQYSTNSGATFLDIGAVTQASGRVIAKTNGQLRYIGAATTEVALVTYLAWDSSDSSGNGSSGIDATLTGSTTAFSDNQDIASLTLRSVVDAIDDTDTTDEHTVLNTAAPGVLTNDINIGVVYGYDVASYAERPVTVNTDGSFQYDPTGYLPFDQLDAGETATDTFRYVVANGTSATDAWTVTAFQAASIADLSELVRVESVARGNGSVTASDGEVYTISNYSVINDSSVNYESSTTADDFQTGDSTFPGGITGDNIIVKAQATVLFPAGTYRIGINSDDHSLLRLYSASGITFSARGGHTSNVFTAGNELENADSNEAVGTFTVGTPTTIHIYASFREGGGGDYFEIAIDADGDGDGTAWPGDYELLAPGVNGLTFLEQDEAEVVVTVTGVDDAPVAVDDAYTTDEDTLIASSVAYSTLINSQGPLAYYQFDERAGTTASDSTAGGRDGTLSGFNGTQWQPGLVGNSIMLIDSDDFVDVNSNRIPVGADWTISTFFLAPLPNTGNAWHTLIRGTNHHHIIAQNNTNILGAFVGGFDSAGFDMNTVTAGWRHLAAVGTGGTTTFYIDGVDVGTAADQATDDVRSIGNWTNANQRFADQLDELAFFNRVLTLPEIQAQVGPRPVISNDSDAELHAFTVVKADGTSFATSISFTSGKGAAVTLSSDGTFSYDPSGSTQIHAEAGLDDPTTDTFTYVIQGSGGTGTATVVITIDGVRDIEDDSYAADEDATLFGSDDGTTTPLDANDDALTTNDTNGVDVVVVTAVQGVPGSVGVATATTIGGSVIISSDGAFSYSALSSAAAQALIPGQTITDTFTYTASRYSAYPTGRFIRVTNNGAANRRMDAGEIEAFGPGETFTSNNAGGNAAIDFATAAQGATFHSIGASGGFSQPHGNDNARYINGAEDTGGNTPSLQGAEAFVIIDFGQDREIQTARVHQRNDGCCQDRLRDFTVSILADDGAGNPGAVIQSKSYPAQPPTNLFGDVTYDDLEAAPAETATVTVTVSGLNDAPVLDDSTAPALTGTDEDTLVDNLVSAFANAIISDVDATGAVKGIAVIATAGNGTWQYSTGGGFVTFSGISANSGLLLDEGDSLRYIPDALNSETPTITFQAWDQTTGSAGSLGTVAVNGGTTAFSTVTEVASLVVTAVNDAPLLDGSGTPSFTGTNEDTISPGDTVAIMLASSTPADPITDVDNGAVEGIAIYATANNGTWQYDTGGGFTSFPTVNESTALLLRATDTVRYVPDGLNGETATISFYGWDQAFGTAGLTSNAVTRGGTTAFSTNVDVASLISSALNDAPSLDNSGTPSILTTDEDTNSPATAVSAFLATGAGADPLTDPDFLPLEGIGIIATSGNGTWQYDTGGGFTSISGVTASSALLLRATDSLRYVPDQDNGETAFFTFLGWDQFAGTAGVLTNPNPNGGTTAYSTALDVGHIIVTHLNDAPVLDDSDVMDLTTITENETLNTGELVLDLINFSTANGNNAITDVDLPADPEGWAIVGSDVTGTGGGTWQYSTDSGATWVAMGTVNFNSALLLRAGGATDLVRFVPDAANATTANLTIYAWDQNTNSASERVDLATIGTGGTTAFSTEDEEDVTILVTAINDPPIISGTQQVTGLDDEFDTAVKPSSAFPFSTVTIIDVDLNPADNLTLTVTMDDCNKGSLDVGATGFAETGAGTRIYTYAAVNAGSATTAIRGLLFYPFENRIYPGSFDTSSFTIAVNDGTDTASDSATTVEVESINDVPEIVNTTTGQTVQDDQFLKPFEFTTLTDDDNNPGNRCTNAFTPAQVLGVSVVLDSGAKGELQHRISMPGGLAADNIDVWASTPSGIFDGVEVEFVNTLSDGTANATYNSANRRLIVNITSGVTCAYAVVDAVNALTGAFAFSAEMNNVTDANPNPGNDVVFAASSGMTSFSHLTQVSSSVYVTNTGNRDTVKSLLRILTFEPTEDRVGPGSTETTTLFVTMTDGLATVSDNTTTVISHGQNDAPTIPAQTLTVSEDAIIGTDITSLNGIDFLTTFLGADDDPGHTAALTYGIRPPGGSGAAAFSIALNGTITVADSSLIDFETNTLFKLEIIATDPLGATNGSFFEQKLGACNPATDDFLGSSVAVDGDYIAIGAKFADIGADVDAGAVYVFEKSGLAWQQVSRLLPSVVAAGGNFGSAVALSGNLLLIGAEGQDQAFLFQRIGGSWTEITGPIVGSDTAGGDSFGASVDIDGTNYVIGAPLNDADGTDAGAAYLFGAVTTKLVPSDIQIGDLVGASVAIDGTSAIVSAPNEDSGGVDAGSAYVFVNGTEQGKLSPSDGQNADQFGTDVDIVGDTAIIGSALHDSEAFAAGAAYVFVRVAGVWEQQEKLVASDAALSDNFGAAVAITDELSNLTVAIGSPFDDDAGTDSGSIYTFVRDVNTNWLQDLKETADDGAADDRFGSRIDLDGKQLVVGAHFADVTKNATLYQDSGASYVINVDRGEICIVVVDANDPPVIADGSFTIDENVANLTAVGTVDSSDEDVADVLTHVIDAGNGGGAFQITAAGELQVLNLPGLNFEFTNSYVLTVRVNDNGAPSLSDTASITVTVNDINEAPVATDAIYTVDEHTAIGSQITTLNVTDEDSGQSLAHTITSGNSAGIFALDVNTGAITVANDTLLDFELTTSYTLTVLVVDNGSPSLSDTATITINVNDLNEAPVAVNVTYSILEDATAGTPVGTAGATDPDGDALIYNFTAGNTNTAFNIDGAGNITVNNPADFEATSQYVLSLDITDTGPLTTAITVTINLVEVNEDPVLVCPPGPGTMDELTTLSLTATATDSDLPAQTLTFSLGASTTALGVGINSSTGEFSWTPSEAQGPGVYNLTVCVSDTIATVCTTLSITVDDINSPPTLAAIGDKSAIEGIQLTFTAVGDDTDIPAQTISFSLNDPGGTGASIDGAGNFVWTPNANQGSVGGTPYVMSVIVTDSSGLSTSEQITITVYEAAASVGTPACWMNVAGLDLGPGSDVTRRVLDEPGEHRTFQAGAISCGCILGDNGFVQTTVDETTSSRMFGLSDDNDQGQHFSDILYAMFLDSNGQLSIYEEGGQAESFDAVTYVSGDILRVEVVGTTVNYLQNGLILYTSTRLVSQSDYPLKFDISMQTDGATLRDNVMSPQVPASPRIVDFVANDPSHTDNVLSAGDTLQIYFDSATNQPGGSVDSLFQFSQGLGSSYSGSWNNASCYGVTILDASGNGSPTIGVTTVSPLPGGTAINDASGASAASYVVSPVLRGDFGTTEPNTSGITWQNFINSAATPNSNDLLESSLNNHDYGAAVSVETFAYGDISIHFVPDQTDAEIFFGFTSLIGNSSSDPADIRYAAVLKTDGTFGAQTAETFQPDLGLSTYQAGDLITISIVGTTVTFYINGNLVHTSPVPVDPSDFPLAVDVSIGTGSISNARYSSSANVNAPPQLVSVVGNDPDDGDRILSGGDTITFTFDQATNQPTGQFASLFSSSATIGQTFSGGWTSALAYTVTITNPAGSTLTLDSSSFAVAGSTPITNAAGTSGGADASFGSITLSGDWGIVPLTAGNVVWENSTNATDGGGGTLNKTGSSNAWDAYGDSSASYLFGPAYTELAVVTVDQAYLFGFDVTGARPHNDTAAFGIKVDTFNTLHVLEGISQIGTFGTVRASDVLRVAIDAAGAVTYLKNDQVFYTSAQTASFPLEIVGSIFSGSGSIDGLVRSDPPVSFPPVLNSAIADDPDNLDEIVSNGDTITLKTDIATNSPGGAGVQAKAAVDALFTASVSLGGDYIGQWVTASCFRITLVNVSGEGGLTIDQTTLTPAGTTPILDAAGTSPASSASSPALAGDFGDVRNPGEDAIWTALYNVTVLASEPNTLCKSDTADVNQPAGAVTDQTIARNTRGEAYIEVDARVANRDRLIGFTEFDAITALSHITYGAMIDQQGRFLIYERGVLIGQFGSYTAGATIRVSMLSNQTVAYYVDGALRYTSADTILPTSDLPLRGAAYLQSAGAKISNARVSFPPAPVRFAQATAGAGYTLSILTSVATDQPAGAVDDLWSFSHVIGAAYSGSWTTPSVYVITVTDTTGSTLQAGLSTVTAAGTVPILDSTPVTLSPAANGTSPVMIGPFNAEDDGRAVNWSNVTNASVAADNTLCKTSPTALNTSGARSTASVLAGDAFLQFQIDALDKTYAVGWANSDPDHALNTIDFAFYVDGNNGGLGIRENGLTIADGFGTLAIDDVLRIELSGGQILYKKNGATIYTSLQTLDPADYPYHVDVSLITQGACAFNVRTSMPADDQPIITAFSVSDPDDLDAVYSNGDVFEVKFDRATNRAPNGNGNILNTAEVDDLFTVHNLLTGPAVLGTGYSGRWASASCFSITVTDISDTVGIELSQLVIIPIGLTPILDSTGTSDASEAPSPFLTGRFGLPNQIVWEIPRDVRIDASSLQRINDPGNASNWSAGAQSTIFLTTGSAYLETRVGETTTNRMIGWTSLPAFDPGDDHHFSTIEWAAYLTAGGQFKVWRRPGRFVENLGSYSVNDIIRVAIDPAGPSVTWSVNGAVRYTFTPVVGTESELRYPVRVRASIETFAGTILDGTTNITPPSIPSIIGYSSAGNGSDTPDPGETYTITFSQATDQPFDDTVTLETTDIDSLFIFNGSIGSAYTGVWTTPSIFTITIVDGSGGSTPVGSATVTARGGPAPLELVIRNAAGTSNAAFTTSPALTGSARSATSGSGDSASEALTEAVTVSLSAGWSLIALPITPLDASAATLFGDLPVSQIHSRVGDIDLPATDLSVGTGYWAYNAGEGTEAVIIGVRSSGSRDLPAGWSTVGVPVSTAVPAGAVAYRHENGAFVPVETLEPGTGYWLHLNAPTTLTW